MGCPRAFGAILAIVGLIIFIIGIVLNSTKVSLITGFCLSGLGGAMILSSALIFDKYGCCFVEPLIVNRNIKLGDQEV